MAIGNPKSAYSLDSGWPNHRAILLPSGGGRALKDPPTKAGRTRHQEDSEPEGDEGGEGWTENPKSEILKLDLLREGFCEVAPGPRLLALVHGNLSERLTATAGKIKYE